MTSKTYSANDVREMLQQAYAAGFMASGEGYNGEYPYGDQEQYECNEVWAEGRDTEIRAIMGEMSEEEYFVRWATRSGGLSKQQAQDLFAAGARTPSQERSL